jgi:archaellum biogenesis ATPase FlaH
MRDAGALDQMSSLQLDLGAGVLEESLPVAEEYRHEVELEFVEESRLQQLLGGIRGADRDVLFLTRRGLRLT